MTVRHQLTVSVVAAVALFASAITPMSTVSVSAQAQPAEGKGPKGTGQSGKTSPPTRPNPSQSTNRAPSPKATEQRTSQPRNVTRNRDNTPNRVVIRDNDRRRGDGDRRRGTRHVWGPGFTFYFYDGFYHGDCSWLRRKARETGSRYWRNRYEKCRDE